jgi:hypothetical protein
MAVPGPSVPGADFGTSIPMATLGEGHESVIHSAGA